MRIIGGHLKGRKLVSNCSSDIRPTLGIVKKSVFSILNHKLEQADVLDLFAGTGSLGIEALSRGAKTALFIDCKKKIVRNIKYNLNNFQFNSSNTNVLEWNILNNLDCLRKTKTKFKIIFIDPPYYLNMLKPTILNLIKANVLSSEACIVAEHSIYEVIPIEDFPELVLTDQRKYGKTSVSFLCPIM